MFRSTLLLVPPKLIFPLRRWPITCPCLEVRFLAAIMPSQPAQSSGPNFAARSRLARLAVTAACGAFAAVASFAQPSSTATLTAASTPTLRINEVFAAAAAGGSDEIELHNAGSTAVDISGWSVIDDSLAAPFAFPPGTTIASGGFLTVYPDRNTAIALHAGFALDAEGDEVRLRNPAGQVVDSVKFGFQTGAFSISRTGPDANIWALTTRTPNAPNSAPVPLGSPAELRINEWASRINFRLDHDFIEIYNGASQPVALGGMQLTDDPSRPDKEHLTFGALSFIGAKGSGREFLPLFQGDFLFGLSADGDRIVLLGQNLQTADEISFGRQGADISSGRYPDGSTDRRDFTTPTPGISNQSVLPAQYDALLRYLRITEIMYNPGAGADDYEFIELQNVGPTPLDLSGVRFTNGGLEFANGSDYSFRNGTTLPSGGFIVLARNRSRFLERYPSAASVLAPDVYVGNLDNNGENIGLTLPDPWYVHILYFKYERTWYPTAAGGGYSLVVPAPALALAENWGKPEVWRASAAANGSPGAADVGGALASSRIINLSILTPIAAPGDSFTMGYVVGGSGTAGAKPLVIRAAGPSLGALGVTGTLDDPRLELFAGPTRTIENDNWGGSSQLAGAMAAVGAFPYMSGNSRDAAVALDITSRDNSVKVSAVGAGTGLVIAEVYDATPESGVNATTQRLINVSVLKEFGTGFTAGFVVRGTASKTVLIRAVGPGLANVGVPAGFVADPQLTLFDKSQAVLGSNNDWGGTSALNNAFTQVGAFALPTGSRDAALLASLPPGDYTVQVSGVGGGTGLGLVEVYEVP